MVRLRAGESFPLREDQKPPKLVITQRKVSARRAPAGVHKKSSGPGTSRSAPPPMPRPAAAVQASPSASCVQPGMAAAEGVTLENTDVLNCGVCFQPLKPPIYQCTWGHVVCSSCHDERKPSGNCHLCGIGSSYSIRCVAMERLLESIRMQCPNAAHGCTARLTYYDQHCHGRTCPFTPWQCPGEVCDFFGSKDSLLDHFAGFHGWSCPVAATNDDNDEFDVCLYDGFNFIPVDWITNDEKGGVHASRKRLILMNVARQPFGCTISVLCMHPHTAATACDQGPSQPSRKELRCQLWYSHRGSGKFIEHDQESRFVVECRSLSNGLPNPDDTFKFLVPNSVLADRDTILVGGRFYMSRKVRCKSSDMVVTK